MKIAAVLISMLAASCSHIHASYALDLQTDIVTDFQIRSIADKIKSFLEAFKTTMKTGNPDHGVPVLDPFKLQYRKINLTNDYFNCTGSLNDVFVQDLSNYEVRNADFKIAKWNLTIDLQWASIKGSIGYDLNGKLSNAFPVYGAGDLGFEIQDFRFAAIAKLKMDYKEKKISIVQFDDLLFSLSESKFKLTGLYHDPDISELVSAMLTDVLPTEIQNAQENLKPTIKKLLQVEINKILDKVTLDDIWSIA